MTWIDVYASFMTVIAAILYFLVWHQKHLLRLLSDVQPSEWEMMRQILKKNLTEKWFVR